MCFTHPSIEIITSPYGAISDAHRATLVVIPTGEGIVIWGGALIGARVPGWPCLGF
jgi:hypothetical protein